MARKTTTCLAACATAALGALWWLQPHGALPAAAWRVGEPGSDVAATAYHAIEPEARISFAIESAEPLFVYVVSHCTEDGTIAWFPSPLLRSDVHDPVPAGRTRLPGTCGDRTLSFRGRVGLGATTWIAIASREPLPELDALLPGLRQVSNMTFTDGSIVVSNPRRGAPTHGAGTPLPDGLLRLAAAAPEAPTPNGPMQRLPQRDGVWFATWRTVAVRGADGKPLAQRPLDALGPLRVQPPDAVPPAEGR